MNFTDYFQAATGNSPYDYQSRLAGGDSGTKCRSQLINIPTGLGKTAANLAEITGQSSACHSATAA